MRVRTAARAYRCRERHRGPDEVLHDRVADAQRADAEDGRQRQPRQREQGERDEGDGGRRDGEPLDEAPPLPVDEPAKGRRYEGDGSCGRGAQGIAGRVRFEEGGVGVAVVLQLG